MATAHGDTERLLQQASAGDKAAEGALFSRHEDRLRRMVEMRMDRRLRGRLDPSDVLQEAWLEFSRSLAAYTRNPVLPLYLWLRMITGRKLQSLHRKHLGAEIRDAGREVSLFRDALPQASSECLAAQLLGHITTPSQAAVRTELQLRVQDALNSLDAIDREILSLRHFELLSNFEAARVLGLSETAASNRFVRAVRRLKKLLADVPELFGDSGEEYRGSIA